MENKKNEDKRIERRIPLHFLIGLNVALLLTLAAFEWKTEVEKIDLGSNPIDEKIIWDDQPQIKVKTIPPKPKPTKPDFKEVKEEVIEHEDLKDLFQEDTKTETEIFEHGDFDFEPEPLPVEKPAEVFLPFEAQPDFEGGMDQFYAFLAKKVKYPASAKRMGIEGKVHVSFIVEPDGSLSNIEIVKGLSPDCDKEALRVMRLVTGFIPGEQRGIPVRVKMTVPIFYRLH